MIEMVAVTAGVASASWRMMMLSNEQNLLEDLARASVALLVKAAVKFVERMADAFVGIQQVVAGADVGNSFFVARNNYVGRLRPN